MNFEDFKKEILIEAEQIDLQINEEKIKKFFEYMNLLIEWNKKVNLTAITEPKEIITKHFIDSLTILKYIENNEKVIDVGTGAGFPGIPLAIASNNKITLLDSLNKRVTFLNEVKNQIKLENVFAYHGRAEEFAKQKENREKYDVAVSRAVASMNVLLEYLLPFVKVGGKVICMKGPNVDEEMKNIDRALETLGGKVEKIEEISLEELNMERKIIIIKKIKNTPSKYPRKAGTPAKEPII